MKAILLVSLLASTALAAPRTANLHLLYSGDDRANQNWATLDSTIGRLSLFLGSPSSVGTTNLFGTANVWSAQQRFSGANGGIDVDGDLLTNNGVGVAVELGAASPLTGPAPAFFWALSGRANNTTSASFLAQTATSDPATDGVIATRRSYGSFGAESAIQTGGLNVLGTFQMQTWKSGLGYNAVYDPVWAKECYPSQNHAPTTEGVSCKEFAMKNGTGGTGSMQTINYTDPSGNTQLPFAVLIGGGASLLTPQARLNVFEQTAATASSLSVLRLEENDVASGGALGGGANPFEEIRLAHVSTTTATNVAAGAFAGAASTVYQVEMRAVGRCTAGAGCTVGQGVVCHVRGMVTTDATPTATLTASSSVVDYCWSNVTGAVGTCAAGAECAINAGNTACGAAGNICGVLQSPGATETLQWDVSLTVDRISS